MATEVVITGLGMVTPLGDDPAEVLRRIEAGDSAARPPSRFDGRPFGCPVCAEIADFDAGRCVPEPKTLRLMNRDAVLAVAAARLAIQDAGVKVGADYASDAVALFGATGRGVRPKGLPDPPGPTTQIRPARTLLKEARRLRNSARTFIVALARPVSLAIPDDKAKRLLESAGAETDTTTRHPLLLRLSGLLLFRFAARQLFGLLFQLPPRKTRDVPDAGPWGSVTAPFG